MPKAIIGPGTRGHLQLGHKMGRHIQTDIENWSNCRDARAWCYREAVQALFQVDNTQLSVRGCLALSLLSEKPSSLAGLRAAINEEEASFQRRSGVRKLFLRPASDLVVRGLVEKLAALGLVRAGLEIAEAEQALDETPRKRRSMKIVRTPEGAGFMQRLN